MLHEASSQLERQARAWRHCYGWNPQGTEASDSQQPTGRHPLFRESTGIAARQIPHHVVVLALGAHAVSLTTITAVFALVIAFASFAISLIVGIVLPALKRPRLAFDPLRSQGPVETSIKRSQRDGQTFMQSVGVGHWVMGQVANVDTKGLIGKVVSRESAVDVRAVVRSVHIGGSWEDCDRPVRIDGLNLMWTGVNSSGALIPAGSVAYLNYGFASSNAQQVETFVLDVQNPPMDDPKTGFWSERRSWKQRCAKIVVTVGASNSHAVTRTFWILREGSTADIFDKRPS